MDPVSSKFRTCKIAIFGTNQAPVEEFHDLRVALMSPMFTFRCREPSKFRRKHKMKDIKFS